VPRLRSGRSSVERWTANPEYGTLLAVPNIKAAIKWVRQTERRTVRNLSVRTRLKTLFKKAKTGTDVAYARNVESAFDKAAQKGIIHPNKAARKKARLARAIRVAATAAAAAPAVVTRSTKAKTKKR